MERKQLMGEFLREMYRHCPDDARVMGCQFAGDPNDDIKGKWVARIITQVAQLDDEANVYLAVSAMGRNARGEFRRRKENFRGGLLLMIDDVGSGPGSKFPLALVQKIPPTALVETSPGNHQAVYMFDRLVDDIKVFDALINGFIAQQFLGRDTGMAGVNRVFRPPFGRNGKAKYGGWAVRAVSWDPDARYSPEALAAAFGIELDRFMPARAPIHATIGRSEGIRAFVQVRSALRAAGLLKRDEPDMSGWQDIVCPWTAGHTGGVDNGAAIREPAEENGWCGAFRCHHGSCAERGWRDLTDWLAENDGEILAAVNARAGTFQDYVRSTP